MQFRDQRLLNGFELLLTKDAYYDTILEAAITREITQSQYELELRDLQEECVQVAGNWVLENAIYCRSIIEGAQKSIEGKYKGLGKERF